MSISQPEAGAKPLHQVIAPVPMVFMPKSPFSLTITASSGRAHAAFDPAAALLFERDNGRRIERRAA